MTIIIIIIKIVVVIIIIGEINEETVKDERGHRMRG